MRPEHWLYTVPLRLRSLFQRSRIERELDDELQFHLEQRIAHEISLGKTPEQARYAALRAMQGMEQQKEHCRDARHVNFFDDFQRNLRYALRGLRHSPGFAAVIIITLALGVGANTAIFSLVDTIMLKLLPVKAPEQLYFVAHGVQYPSRSWNYPDYCAMRDRNSAFAGLAAYSLGLESLGIQTGSTADQSAELSHGIFVSGNYFEVLGVAPALGRFFNSEDDRAPGAAPYAILSYSYWQSRFAGDPQVTGRKLRVNGYPLIVIGVAPPAFTGADVAFKPELFIPIMMRSEVLRIPFATWNDRHNWWMAAIGRLRPGANIKHAESELFAICKDQQLAEARRLPNPKYAQAAEQIVLAPAAHGFSYLANELTKPLLILFVVVALVLLIACANIASLMLARGAARQREIAVRLAIGAGRWRVVSQLLTESLFIALIGGLAGFVVSLSGTRFLMRFVPQPASDQITNINPSLDWRILAFTLTVCILTGLFFGIAPALQSTRPDLIPSLKEDLPGSIGTGRFTLRKSLVILQLALSLPLVLGAALFARTLANLRGLDTGFFSQNVVIASVDPTRFGYTGQRTRYFYDRLCARVAGLPGVRSASLALITPLDGSGWTGNVTVEGHTPKEAVFFDAVGPRYFETIGTPLILGREFSEQDNPATAIEIPTHIVPGMRLPDPPGQHTAIVNQTFARHFFGSRNPIGTHVDLNGGFRTTAPYEIVGVVKDARYNDMREIATPMMFIPTWRRFVERRDLVIRASGPDTQLATLLRREIHELNPTIPLISIRTLEHDVDQNILNERLIATLSGFFGILALLLSAVGLYGVMAYTVTRRTREIGIRIAIGASRSSVFWLVCRDATTVVLIGAAIGALASFLSTQAIASILYGVSVNDPLSLSMAAFSLSIAAILACFLPARRAAQTEPVIALRYE